MAREFLAKVVTTCYTRRYMSLRDSGQNIFFGLAPERSEEGDSVIVLQGCSVHVVLRRSHKRDGVYWDLIGECFVYGVMDSEAMADLTYHSRLQEYELV